MSDIKNEMIDPDVREVTSDTEIKNEVKEEIQVEELKPKSNSYVLDDSVAKTERMSQEELEALMVKDAQGEIPDTLTLPTGTTEKYVQTILKAGEVSQTNSDYYTEEENGTFWALNRSEEFREGAYPLGKDKYQYFKSTGNLNTNVEYKGKDIKMESLNYLDILNRVDRDKKMGDDLVLKIFNSFTGAGESVKVVLWNSGFSVNINPPTVDDISSTKKSIAEDMIKIGRETAGLSFSALSSVAVKHILALFYQLLNKWPLHVDKQDIFNHISVLDINSITLGILKSMFPEGKEISTSCVNCLELGEDNKPKCNFHAKARLDLAKLEYKDLDKIPMGYRDLFVKTSTMSIDPTSAAKYREIITKSDLTTQKLEVKNKELLLKLKVPTINEYLEESEIYMEDLIRRVENSIGKDKADKDSHITVAILSTYINIYSSFIKELVIEEPTGDIVLDNKDQIRGILASICAKGAKAKMINEKIINFINDVNVTVIGTPNYICPQCKTQQPGTDDDRFNSIIPLDIVKIFFILATQHITTAVNTIDS